MSLHLTHPPGHRHRLGTAITLGVLLAVSFLTGCANAPAGATQTTIAQTEVALTAAEKAAMLYVTLPQCTPATKPICSEAPVIVQIKAADNVAFNAVMAARRGGDSATVATANAAIATLVTLIPAATTH